MAGAKPPTIRRVANRPAAVPPSPAIAPSSPPPSKRLADPRASFPEDEEDATNVMSSSILDAAELQIPALAEPYAGGEGRNTFPLEGRPTLPDDMFRNVAGGLETTAVMPNAPLRPPDVGSLVDFGEESVRTPRVSSLERQNDDAFPLPPRDRTPTFGESRFDSPPHMGEPPLPFSPRGGSSLASVPQATAPRPAYSAAPPPFPATAAAPAPTHATAPTSLGFVFFAMPLALATMAVATLALR